MTAAKPFTTSPALLTPTLTTTALYRSSLGWFEVATKYEVEAIAKVVETEPFDIALPAFRAVFDHTLVPTSLQRQVTDYTGGPR